MPQLRMPIRRDCDFIAHAENAADAAHYFLTGCADSRVEERLKTTDITSIHRAQWVVTAMALYSSRQD